MTDPLRAVGRNSCLQRFLDKKIQSITGFCLWLITANKNGKLLRTLYFADQLFDLSVQMSDAFQNI